MPVLAVETPRGQRSPSEKQLGYFVPAEEFEALQAEVAALKEQVTSLQRQKDHYVAKLDEAYRTLIPVPLTDEELEGPVQNPDAVRNILAELDAK